MKNIGPIILLLFVIAFSSCRNDVAKRYEAKPHALARMNEIVVLADEDLWDSPVKDTFEYYFQSAYPILPSPEPMFDVRYFSPRQLDGEPLRKELRTYIIIADLSDTESYTTKMVRSDLGEERYLKAKSDPSFNTSVGKDKWARGQILVYIFANNKKQLQKAITENYPAIANRVRLHDRNQLDASIYVLKKENPGLINKLNDRFGFKMRIPGGFINVLPEEDDIMYFKNQTKEALMNIIVKKFPYESESQITKENIISIRDEYGAKYITSEAEGSYMVTNTDDLPTYTYTYEIDGMYTMEVRGIWEMENDFKGGPYSSYMILNKNRNELIFIDAFVLAIGKSKRNLMMQLDYIIKTAVMSEVTE